jgi:hypothetical protein
MDIRIQDVLGREDISLRVKVALTLLLNQADIPL